MPSPTVSVVINNFNYARYLRRAIDSALGQTYPHTEVVVVDDASTDGSPEVVRGYGSSVTAVLRVKNGGQGAALNDAFPASRGEIVLFLDSDDYLYPHAVARVVDAWRPGTAKGHFRLDLVDAAGAIIDVFPPPEFTFDSGDLRQLLMTTGRYQTTVTSGNAFARSALERMLPIPEEAFARGADGYLVTVAPLFGDVISLDECLGAYCQHGLNHSDFARQLPERARWRLDHDRHRYEALARNAPAVGLSLGPAPGLRDPWHLENRLVSLCLDPAQHPMPEDSRAGLALRGVSATLQRARLPMRQRALLATWFLAAGLLPKPIARTAVEWRLSHDARPPAIDKILKALRRVTR